MTRAENYVTLEFLSRSSNEGFARVAAAGFAAQLDPTLDELGDIKTAVSEAVTNAIVHAYPDQGGKVVMKLKILTGGMLEITIGAVSKMWSRPAVPCIPPAAASAAAWALRLWRASRIGWWCGLFRERGPRCRCVNGSRRGWRYDERPAGPAGTGPAGR